MRNFQKRFYRWAVLSAALFVLLVCLPSCKIGRFIFYNFADIKDYRKFPSRPLTAASQPFYFHTTADGKHPRTIAPKGDTMTFAQYLQRNKTVAFLIIRKDTIQYEKYFSDYAESSIVPSFSMAKSFISMLIGFALQDGLIQSVEEPVTNYIPELREEGFDKVSLRQVLQMTSGLKFNEGYTNPFGDVATFYYGRNLRKAVVKMKLENTPGEKFDYQSGNTQLLGLVLDRALKGKSITDYFQEKLWTPLGMEYDASWSIDKNKNGLEKTYCCVNARARDFAKLGRLYLHNGNWNGTQLLPESWVEESTKVDTLESSSRYYQYQWWLPTPDGDFVATGLLGQYIYVNPAKELIIVRLGKNEGKVDWWTIFVSLAKGY